jgi:hypothetical protein
MEKSASVDSSGYHLDFEYDGQDSTRKNQPNDGRNTVFGEQDPSPFGGPTGQALTLITINPDEDLITDIDIAFMTVIKIYGEQMGRSLTLKEQPYMKSGIC